MKQRIAIIGSGIAGLTCGHLLSKEHHVTLYEANDYIGGHTATKMITVNGQTYPIDTGFIVFNDWTYPNFIRLMDRLNVHRQPTEMSFSVFSEKANLEYNGNNLNTLFAQRRNLLRPRFWRIVRDIVSFNRLCKDTLASDTDISNETLGSFVAEHKLSEDFCRYYLYPMCAAIWSSSLAQVQGFPLRFFLQFFNNHGLLNISNRPQWYTLSGGSHSYIAPMTEGFKQQIHLQTPVQSVSHTEKGLLVTLGDGQQHIYDHVIFACHSDQALRCLAAPSDQQKAILGGIPYANNDVVLHTDTRLLPKRPLAWASWNYQLKETASEEQAPASVTYNMNILQRIEAPVTFCVTLNNTDAIDESKILGRYQYAHPQFSSAMVGAQKRRSEICGISNVHFCGAYWYNGFHEDGVRSALDVCARFGVSL